MVARGLKAWTEKLRKQDMPVLGDVIAELNEITGDDDANVNQLAEVILRDPQLTSHVLRSPIVCSITIQRPK
jgi:HDOD domain.